MLGIDHQLHAWLERRLGIQTIPLGELFVGDAVCLADAPQVVTRAHLVTDLGLLAAATACQLLRFAGGAGLAADLTVGRDHQLLTATQVVAAQIVGQLQLTHADAMILGDARQGIATGDLIGAGTNTLALGQIGQCQLQGIGILYRYQQAVRATGRHHTTAQGRIDLLEL